MGRAAGMPRERRQGMDARSARAHGASSECGYPTKSGPTRSLALLVTFGAFSKVTRRRGGKVIRRHPREWICPPPQCQTPRTQRTQQTHPPRSAGNRQQTRCTRRVGHNRDRPHPPRPVPRHHPRARHTSLLTNHLQRSARPFFCRIACRPRQPLAAAEPCQVLRKRLARPTVDSARSR